MAVAIAVFPSPVVRVLAFFRDYLVEEPMQIGDAARLELDGGEAACRGGAEYRDCSIPYSAAGDEVLHFGCDIVRRRLESVSICFNASASFEMDLGRKVSPNGLLRTVSVAR